MTLWTLATSACLLLAQAGAPAPEAWLRGLEGSWRIENPRGTESDIVLTVGREGNVLVLKAVVGDLEIVTRYDLTGASQLNENFGRKAYFVTRIDGRKMVTQIWERELIGPATRVETRYLEAADKMVTELSKTAGGPSFSRTVLLRRE